MKYEFINFIKEELSSLTEYKPIDIVLVNYFDEDKKRKINYSNILNKCSLLAPLVENFKKIDSAFEQEIYLKFSINNMYKKQPELDRWIVQAWGGIATHKAFDTLHVSKNNKSFDRISSWSKIASFEDLKNNIIYDSRVIYSLNWLIYKYNKLNKKYEKYLHQPSSRSRVITLLPVNSIIAFENSEKLDLKKQADHIYGDIFINKNDSYNYLVALIKMINESLFKNMQINIPFQSEVVNMEEYPFFTEMLLFKMADKEIFNDVKKSISVNIKK